ncbi:sodium:solute symporter [Oscillibacter sp. GMB15532]|uniref:sodium:solute symporter family protein n=1 Tax=Oscillibacter sp. GMB15532 TaxID=3230022 RepID=UPI0034DF3591
MLTTLDNITIILCVVGVFAISHIMGRKSKDMESFYHANKSLPWSLAVGTIAASWYGGNGTIGTVGYATTMGLAAFFIWSIGAHLVRFPLALWMAPKISVKVNSTMTELLNRFYGRIASFIGAIVLIVSCLSISEIAATGYVGIAAWGANKFVVAAIVIAISILLTCVGGLMGVAITDMIFFFFMIMSVSLVFPQAFFSMGGFAGVEGILNAVDPGLMTPLGGIAPGKAIMLILVCINVYKDPAFYQRFTASNGPKTGKRAMLTCFSIWMSMDACLMFTAIVIRAQDPLLTVQPEVAYITLVLSGLPVVLRGLFIFGMMGAIISTVDTYYLIGGEILANDIVSPLCKKPLNDRQSILIARIACVGFGVIGLAVAFRFALVYDAMIFVTSLSMSVLFVPVIAAIMYEGKKTNMAGLASMFAGGGAWIWFSYKPISIAALGGPIDASLVALPLSFVAFLIGNRFGRELNHGFAVSGGANMGTAIDTSAISMEEYKKETKVEWFGVDGALCLLYAGLACVYTYGILNRVDWIIGWMAPIVAATMTTLIFGRYLFEVFSFGKGHHSRETQLK